ncbi:MAG: hypothetical protein P1V97_38830 [Planctomycetota bacterium]|nr:hypothetical protein [Planctomycetota bacterium]
MASPDDHDFDPYDRPLSEFSAMPSQVELQRKRRRFLATLVVGPIAMCLLFALSLQVEYYFSDENKARTELEPGMKQIVKDIKGYEFTDETYLKTGVLPIKLRAIGKKNLDKFHAPPELDYKLYHALDPKLRANQQKDVKFVLHCVYYRVILKEKRHKTRVSRSGDLALIGIHTAEFVSLTLYDLETKSQMQSTVIEGTKTKIENSADFESRIDLVAPSQIIAFLNELPRQ